MNPSIMVVGAVATLSDGTLADDDVGIQTLLLPSTQGHLPPTSSSRSNERKKEKKVYCHVALADVGLFQQLGSNDNKVSKGQHSRLVEATVAITPRVMETLITIIRPLIKT
jgi:hypothetical protein